MTSEYANVPRQGDRMRAHSVLFQRNNAAAAGYAVVSGMDPVRSSATAVLVAAGYYRSPSGVGIAFTQASITGIPAASSGKHRYDLIVFDCTDSTLKRVAGTEAVPTLSTDFLENLSPLPPELPNLKCILIAIICIDSTGVQSGSHGHYCTAGVADFRRVVPVGHAQNTDTYLNYGGANQVAAADVKDAVTKKHTQNTDTYLNYGGANQVAVADAKDAVTKKHTQGTDQGLDTGGSYPSTAQQVYNSRIRTIGLVMDNGGYALVAGTIFRMKVDYPCTIQSVELVADQSGSIVVDIWKAAYASLPATVSNTITASAKPTLSSALKSQDTTLTGWTKTIAAGDYLYFKIDSATTVTAVTISLKALVS